MSDNIPFEIQVEIIKRIPVVKSLIRFRSVSKQWKSVIDSSEFINDHTVNQTQPHHLLVRYTTASFEVKYVSIVDDDSFPHHKYYPTVPPAVNLVTTVSMLDSSHGLVCFCGYASRLAPRHKSIVLWNPSIRKYVGMVLPFVSDLVGFGVCPKTCDPTIVAITSPSALDWKAQVFTLSTGAWRSISMNLPMPPKLVAFTDKQAVIDGVIHWVVNDFFTECSEMIISFDLTSEEFGAVDLPDSLAHPRDLSVFKLKDTLALLDYHFYQDSCDVWMITKNSSFTKLYTVRIVECHGSLCCDILGFRKNGQPITQHEEQCGSDENSAVYTLKAYESDTKPSTDLGIDEDCQILFMMTSYTESLLLLYHPDSIIR